MNDYTVLIPLAFLVAVTWAMVAGMRREYRRVRIGKRLGLL